MNAYPDSMQKLIRELSKLPSIGEKSAIRLAYHLVNNDSKLCITLADALRQAKESVRFCSECFHLTENKKCRICEDSSRDRSLICVVEKPADLISIERVGEYRGLYHVLHGLWAPLKGKGAESMKIDELIERVKRGGIREVIIATGATVEGDATALYLARLLEKMDIVVTRPAQGLPKGGELEYADDVTLSRAFAARRAIASQ
ncbi:MAG: recombination protein RecR [Candidatus Dadabacteria bacterium]|nr:MAG: recombination protein RecR [Candidatus Dadabacteria bacterium]